MARARSDASMTQGELGRRVGTSQNMVSNIESGKVASSKFILPICKVLGIPPPMFFESEEQKAWSQLGHLLRRKSMKKFARAMALVEAMAEDDEDEAKPPAPANRDQHGGPARR